MKILYATDDTAPARSAGRLLMRMAEPDHNEITVLSVAPVPTPAAIGFDPAPRDVEPMLRGAAGIAEKEVSRLSEAGFKATSAHSAGHPGAEIVRHVEQDGYDLTVMGAGTRTWLNSLLLGSVSTHVLHSSPTSVLIVHDAAANGETKVLFGTDGSDDARVAETVMAELFDKGVTSVEIISVGRPAVSADMVVFGAPYSLRSIEDEERTIPRIKNHARRRADGAGHRLLAASLHVDTRKGTIGYPSLELLREAETRDVDVVVVGSRGLGPVRRALLGSVSDHVTRHARAALVARNNR